MRGWLEFGRISTQVRPGASDMVDVATFSVVSAFSEGRLQVPLTTVPPRNTHAVPEPITRGSGTTVPWESWAAVLDTPTDMTTTFVALT